MALLLGSFLRIEQCATLCVVFEGTIQLSGISMLHNLHMKLRIKMRLRNSNLRTYYHIIKFSNFEKSKTNKLVYLSEQLEVK
jgi:hypothetical protein